MPSGFPKKTPVTVICGEFSSPKPLQTMKIKTVHLRNSAIHLWVLWWVDCILVTTAWRWATSTKLQQLLVLGVAERGLRRWGETFPRLEESHEDDIPTCWHSQLCVNRCRDLRQRCCPKERLRELPAPTCKLTAHPDGCSCSAALGLTNAPLLFPCWKHWVVLQTFLGAEVSLLWEGSREKELHPTECEAQKSSGRHIMETIPVTFLWGTRLSNIVLPFF